MPKLQHASYSLPYYRRNLLPDGIIHWSEAESHMNETVSIYGEVVYTEFDWGEYERYAGHGVEPPCTYIEIGMPYDEPGLVLIVIRGRDWAEFEMPPSELYRDRAVVFSGRLLEFDDGEPDYYQGRPTVQIAKPDSIRIVDPIEDLYTSNRYSWGNCVPIFDEDDDDGGVAARELYDAMQREELLYGLDHYLDED